MKNQAGYGQYDPDLKLVFETCDEMIPILENPETNDREVARLNALLILMVIGVQAQALQEARWARQQKTQA